MGRDDWRQDKANTFARWMTTNCEPCPVVECGAMVCGDEQKEMHRLWHEGINTDRVALRDRQEEVEDTFIVTRDQINDALAIFDTDRTALRNRLTLIEGQLATANSQLTAAINALTARVSTLESQVAALQAA